MSTPRISIVTPSYNQAEYIADNLESVKNQTHSNVEHFVLDGGSADGTIDVLRRYEDDEELVWRSETDEGQSDAINKGFDLATGEYVGWLNSDDVYFDTGVLSRVPKHFERTGADVVYGDLAYVDGDSRVTEIDVRPEFDPAKLPYRILVGQPATFFRQDVVRNERLNKTLHYCMDYEFWIRLSRRYDIRHVRDVLAGFRVHSEQKTDDEAATAEETEAMLAEYFDPSDLSKGPGVVRANAETELSRLLASARTTYNVSRRQPPLSFDGEYAPLGEMLGNLGPSPIDVRKALRRWLRF